MLRVDRRNEVGSGGSSASSSSVARARVSSVMRESCLRMLASASIACWVSGARTMAVRGAGVSRVPSMSSGSGESPKSLSWPVDAGGKFGRERVARLRAGGEAKTGAVTMSVSMLSSSSSFRYSSLMAGSFGSSTSMGTAGSSMVMGVGAAGDGG